MLKYIQKRKSEEIWKIFKNLENGHCDSFDRLATFETILQQSEINWKRVSKNPNITVEIVRNNFDKNWNWKNLSKHLDISKEFDKSWPWDYENLSKNQTLRWEIVENNINEKWDWNWLSCNKCVTLDIIEKNPDKNWYWLDVTSNPNVTWEFIEKNLDKNWNYIIISSHILTQEIYKKHPLLFENYFVHICYNPHFDFDFFLNHLDKYLCWYGLSMKADFQTVKKYPDFEWNWNILSEKIDWKFIEENPNFKWNWDYVSQNKSVTFEIVENNNDKSWNYSELYQNPSFIKDLVDYSDVCWFTFSANSNWETVKKFPHSNWQLNWIPFEMGENFKEKICSEYFSALKIKKWWKNLQYF